MPRILTIPRNQVILAALIVVLAALTMAVLARAGVPVAHVLGMAHSAHTYFWGMAKSHTYFWG